MGAKEILDQLDAAALGFPMLDNGYVYPADARLSIYRDVANWMMIIEVLGAYSPRVSAYDSFQNALHIFGSDLHRRPGTANEDFLYPIGPCPNDPLFADEYDWFAKDDARCLMIRSTEIHLDLSPAALASKGITLIEPPHIDPPCILRSLLPEHRSRLLASEEELQKRNPKGLPLWVRLDEWNHPDLAGDELPSASETFQMLAAAIAAANKNLYRPTRPPNTHWSNWPEGGTL